MIEQRLRISQCELKLIQRKKQRRETYAHVGQAPIFCEGAQYGSGPWAGPNPALGNNMFQKLHPECTTHTESHLDSLLEF